MIISSGILVMGVCVGGVILVCTGSGFVWVGAGIGARGKGLIKIGVDARIFLPL